MTSDQMQPVAPDGRGLTRRGVLRGTGAVAFVGLSAAALKLPFFGVDGAQVEAASCVGKDISASDKRLVISNCCLLYTSPSPRDGLLSRMPSSA